MATNQPAEAVQKDEVLTPEKNREKIQFRIYQMSKEDFDKYIKDQVVDVHGHKDFQEIKEIALNDPNWFRRLAAIKKINEPALLDVLMVKETDPEVKEDIVMKSQYISEGKIDAKGKHLFTMGEKTRKTKKKRQIKSNTQKS